MKRFLLKSLVICTMFLAMFAFSATMDDAQAAKKNYTITATSKPYASKYMKSTLYNSKTKQYFMLRSYLEKMEANGGGTLTLKKGTYTITNTLYVPSNVTIKLKDGAIIQKGTSTGTKQMVASKTLMNFVQIKNSTRKANVKKYAGAKNVSLIGEGTATIDMANLKSAAAILLAHNDTVKISGIQFKNADYTTYIQIVGSKNVRITGNNFKGKSTTQQKTAIALETANKSIEMYSMVWSANDNTTNASIKIDNNKFSTMKNAVVSKGYVSNIEQSKIQFTNNDVSNMTDEAVIVRNWKNPSIQNNNFKTIGKQSSEDGAILMSGVTDPTIKGNTFKATGSPVQFDKEKLASNKAPVNTVSTEDLENMKQNKGQNLRNYKIRLTEKSKAIEITNLDRGSNKTYTITPSSKPIDISYAKRPTYTSKTKSYYVLRALLEQLEIDGGGTIIMEKGTYNLSNTLSIPSNVTIKMKNGVNIVNLTDTGLKDLKASSTLFRIVPPSLGSLTGVVSGYNGSSNVHIIGEGTVTIDLKNQKDSFAFIIGHASNISIENIIFKNMNSGHFIELNSSKDVVIDKCQFIGSTPSKNNVKEAINIDSTDKLTEGFNSLWSTHDRTATENVTIQNSKFDTLDRAIGTHKYSGEATIAGVYYENRMHKNVVIKKNTFKNTRNDAIRVMNWDHPVIENNTFENISYIANTSKSIKKQQKRGILASGTIHPTFAKNTFKSVSRAIQFMAWKNDPPGEQYAIIVDELDDADKEALKTNKVSNVDEQFIRITKEFNNFDNKEKIYFN